MARSPPGARAASLGRVFLTLSPEGVRRFLEILAGDFALDAETLVTAAGDYRSALRTSGALKAERRLRVATLAPRVKLLTQFTSLPDGVKFLVDMRAKLLDIAGDDPALASLDDDMRALLASWFDVGFLELQRITWDSPASLLERLIAYEAVHHIRSWEDLQNRLDSDRRCYAFFHPAHAATSRLIFVEVALVKGMADNVQRCSTRRRPRGPARGRHRHLLLDLQHPGGPPRHWLRQLPDQAGGRRPAKQFREARNVLDAVAGPGFPPLARQAFDRGLRTPFCRRTSGHRLPREPRARLATAARPAAGLERRAGGAAEAGPDAARGGLPRRARGDGKPIDPVARFHLGNGAVVERINWLGDTSAKGMTAVGRPDGELPAIAWRISRRTTRPSPPVARSRLLRR